MLRLKPQRSPAHTWLRGTAPPRRPRCCRWPAPRRPAPVTAVEATAPVGASQPVAEIDSLARTRSPTRCGAGPVAPWLLAAGRRDRSMRSKAWWPTESLRAPRTCACTRAMLAGSALVTATFPFWGWH